jgi:hypothetical protein
MTAQNAVELNLPSFSTSALDGGKFLASRSRRFIPGKKQMPF